MNLKEKFERVSRERDKAYILVETWAKRTILAAARLAKCRKRLAYLSRRQAILETCIRAEKEAEIRMRRQKKQDAERQWTIKENPAADPFSPATIPDGTSSPPRNSQGEEATASGQP